MRIGTEAVVALAVGRRMHHGGALLVVSPLLVNRAEPGLPDRVVVAHEVAETVKALRVFDAVGGIDRRITSLD